MNELLGKVYMFNENMTDDEIKENLENLFNLEKTFTKRKNIKKWLYNNNIKNYYINSDLSVDIFERVNLRGKKLYYLPVKFNIVNGYFDCSYNELTNFNNFPKIVKGNLICSNNNFTSLKGCPEQIGGNFIIKNNDLETLEYGPQKIKKTFNCGENKLVSLKGCPEVINGDFICNNNKLLDFEYCPKIVKGNCHFSFNDVIYLEYCPKEIYGNFYCRNKKIMYFNLPEIIKGEISITYEGKRVTDYSIYEKFLLKKYISVIPTLQTITSETLGLLTKKRVNKI